MQNLVCFWSTGVSNVEGKRWDTTVLLEKYVVKDSTMQSDHGRKRTWIKLVVLSLLPAPVVAVLLVFLLVDM